MELLVVVGLHNALLAIPLAVLVLLVATVARRPALMHLLWIIVLLRLLVPPLWRFELPRPLPAESAAISAAAISVVHPPAKVQSPRPDLADDGLPNSPIVELEPIPKSQPEPAADKEEKKDVVSTNPEPDPILPAAPGTTRAWTIPWREALGLAWLGSAGVILAVCLARSARFALALRRSWPAPHDDQRLARKISGRLGIRRVPRVVMVPGRVSPLLWGFIGRAKIVIPDLLWRQLDDCRRAALLAHELAHYRRGDHWVRKLEMLTTALFWWHPVVWIARRGLREAEEQCCDAWVVWALPEARRDYATALLDTVAFLSEDRSVLPALASGVGQVRHLRGRLMMIMRGTTPRRLPRLVTAVLLSGGLALGLLGAGFAQERRDERRDPPPAERRPDAERRADEDRRAAERRAEEHRGPREEERAIREELERARHDLERARQRVEELERVLARRRSGEDRGPDSRPAPTPRSGGVGVGVGVARTRPAPSMNTGGHGEGHAMAGPPNMERRMNQMEERMERMMRQMEEMRRIMERGLRENRDRDRGRGGPPSGDGPRP